MSNATWIKGNPSPYELHDRTHFPDWGRLIVWDAFCNNLTSGFMLISVILWAAGPVLFAGLLPFALTLALALLVIDLFLLILDLGDSWRFTHSLRVFRPTSPLSVGVWGLSAYGIFLGLAVVFGWIVALAPVSSFFWGNLLAILARLCTVLAAIGAIVVICYKGVVFSCTSQPGVKRARWLTAFMIADSLLMGCGLYMLLALAFDLAGVAALLAVPLVVLAVMHCLAFCLLWLDVAPRAKRMHPNGACAIFAWAWGAGGILPVVAVFCGAPGMATAGALVLITGFVLRHWLIGLAKPL